MNAFIILAITVIVFLSIIHSMRHAGHLLLHQRLKGDIRVSVDMDEERKGSVGKPSSRQ